MLYSKMYTERNLLTSKLCLPIIRIMKAWNSEEIQQLRETYNLYQRELAELLGVTRIYVNYLERGVKRPGKTLRLLLNCIEKTLKEKEKGKEVRKYGKRNL